MAETTSTKTSTTTKTTRAGAAEKAATTRKTNAAKRSTAAKKAAGRRAAERGVAARNTVAGKTKASATRARTTAARQTAEARQEVRGPVGRVVDIAETAVLVPVGAALVARDEVFSTFDDIKSKYGTRAKATRRLRDFERRGASALKRVERDAKKTRTQAELIGARIENAYVGGRTAVTQASTSVQERISSLA